VAATPVRAGEGTEAATGGGDREAAGVERLPETVVEAPRPLTAASSDEVRRRDLELRPHLRPADILEMTPGLVVVQHQGGGKANQYYLRGFDEDHGTDLALSVDGVPVNMVTHAHGQGYADLHYLIPELVETEQVNKGPYFLAYGDLATSGAVNLVLRRHLGERSISFQGGEFGVRRTLVMADLPTLAGYDSWVAGEVYTEDGPFDHREDLVRYNFVARAGRTFETGDVWLTGTSYGANWNASGQLPRRAVREGIVGRFGALDPSEGGDTNRHQLYVQAALHPSPSWDVRGLAYTALYDIDLFSNFTFFLNHPKVGDEIEQREERFLGGASLDATHHAQAGRIGLDTRLGFQLRADEVTDIQLNDVQKRFLLTRRTRNRVGEFNYDWYLGEDVTWTEWLRTLVGVRLDHLYFNVRDKLHGQGASPSAGRASETVVSPKASAVVTPRPSWDMYLNFGRGYHSNDARGVTAFVDPASPTAQATGAEIGTRTRLFDSLDLAAAYFLLDLDGELVFVGDEGTTEPKGPTRRHGFELEGRWRITDWLAADVDVTQVTGRFRNLPPGQDHIPVAPRYTVTGGLTARHPRGVFGAVRNRTISDRPANEDDSLTARGFSVFDLELGYAFHLPQLYGPEPPLLTITVDVLNLFDASYEEVQVATNSCLKSELGRDPRCSGSDRVGVPDVDFVPGWPRTVLATMKVAF
jgi:outer membrane receptor protein involved in Fe transport